MNQDLLNFSSDELANELKERSESIIIAYDVGEKKNYIATCHKGDAIKNITSAYRILNLINTELSRSGISDIDILALNSQAIKNIGVPQ